MIDEFDDELWADRLEQGLEAISFLEIKDPTKIIYEAVDSLYEILQESEEACRSAIDKIDNADHQEIALDRLKFNLLQRFAAIMPEDFKNPPDAGDYTALISDFDIKVFHLWAHVDKNTTRLREAVAGLQDAMAAQILQRAEHPEFAQQYQDWLDAENDALFRAHDDEDKKPNLDKKINKAVDNGVAGFIVFLLIFGALAAPLLSMCSAE